ncbi:hypothetical protein Y1Q_0010991 [Alligator mississippiensis]|uniref:Uncharacterized protein n=1 Tax=Alligator mississippiensis TaxID=8496 RepID=A0A151NLD5_ALLMI|nr:hypothetical protein Y1Q_0010991 [Alligator mississippiensis]
MVWSKLSCSTGDPQVSQHLGLLRGPAEGPLHPLGRILQCTAAMHWRSMNPQGWPSTRRPRLADGFQSPEVPPRPAAESLEMPFAGARFATDAPSPRGDGLTHLSFCNVVAVRTSRLIKVQDACHALQAPKTCLFLSSLSIFKEVEVSVLAGRVDLTRKCISPSRDPSGDCAETGNPVTHRKSLHACLTTSFEAAIPFSSHDSRSSGFEKQK